MVGFSVMSSRSRPVHSPTPGRTRTSQHLFRPRSRTPPRRRGRIPEVKPPSPRLTEQTPCLHGDLGRGGRESTFLPLTEGDHGPSPNKPGVRSLLPRLQVSPVLKQVRCMGRSPCLLVSSDTKLRPRPTAVSGPRKLYEDQWYGCIQDV